MATMIPANVKEFKTDSQKQFYKFLKAVKKPAAGSTLTIR
jgi:hypothetical protein